MNTDRRTFVILVALLFGAGLSSLLVLLLNVSPGVISLIITGLLSLGSIPIAVLSRSDGLGPPLAVMAANALAYAAIAYVAFSRYWRTSSATAIRSTAIRLLLPVAMLVSLGCIPALNPLWPRGMLELKKQETELQSAFPVGISLSRSRDVLVSRAIQFHEETESSDAVVLEREGARLAASAGYRVLSARFQTGASVFPCGYDMEIVLLFSPDEKLKEQYVHRLRICP